MYRGNYRGKIAEINTKTIKAFIEKVTLRAFADEGDNGGEAPDNEGDDKGGSKKPPVTNFEELIAKARKEEKEKQYKKIERLEGQVTTLTEQHNNDLLAIAGFEKQVEELNKKLTTAGKGDSEEIKTLKETIETLKGEKSELDKKVKDLESNQPQSREEIEKEVRAELEKQYEVKTYKAEKLAEFKDKLLVPEFVVGETKEDIDRSLEAALAKSDEIRKNLGITDDDNSGDDGGDKKKPTKRTPKTPANPSIRGTEGKEYSIEYLASLDPASKEYAEVRKKLGLR